LLKQLTTKNKEASIRKGGKLVHLTKRELEILKLIAEEYTNQEIAEKLFISPRTVDSHRGALLQKVGVKNTAGLVKYAINHGLVDL
jgi:DNA-binding CsgD family transcriptional regulator